MRDIDGQYIPRTTRRQWAKLAEGRTMRQTDTIPFDWTSEREKKYLEELVRDFLGATLGVEDKDLPENYGYTITVNWEDA